MIKKILALSIALAFFCSVFAADHSDTIKYSRTLNKIDCPKTEFLKKEENVTLISKQISGLRENNYTIVLELNGTDVKKADKNFVFKNLLNQDTVCGQLKDKTLTFSLKNILKGVNDTLFLVLTDPTGKTCYETIIELIPTKKDEGNDSGAAISNLSLTDLPETANPCTSCQPEGHIITYDFSKNSLKNSKTKASTDRTFDEQYLNTRWFNLPWVNKEMAFEVINVNPFKFDVTMSDEQVSLNTDTPDLLTTAFSAPAISATSAKGPSQSALESMVLKMGDEIARITDQYKHAGDCLNVCELVNKHVDAIKEYFKSNAKYDMKSPLEEFLATNLNLARVPEGNTDEERKADKEKIEKLRSSIAAYSTFRFMAVTKFSYRVPQIKNVDQYIFTLNILPKDGIQAGSRVLNQDITVDILGGFKVDASSGLFVTHLMDNKYNLRADSTIIPSVVNGRDSLVYNRRNKVIPEGGNKYDFGVASLFHFYPKITPFLNLAFSLGAGVSINEKPKIRYLAGFSLLGGRSTRVALTVGWAMGFVDELSDRYLDQKDPVSGVIYTPVTDTKVDVKKIFKSSSFVSLTYNLPLMKKKEKVAAAPDASATTGAKSDAKDTSSDSGDKSDKK